MRLISNPASSFRPGYALLASRAAMHRHASMRDRFSAAIIFDRSSFRRARHRFIAGADHACRPAHAPNYAGAEGLPLRILMATRHATPPPAVAGSPAATTPAVFARLHHHLTMPTSRATPTCLMLGPFSHSPIPPGRQPLEDAQHAQDARRGRRGSFDARRRAFLRMTKH